MPRLVKLSEKFRNKYLSSLTDYRAFYDDLDSYGSIANAKHVFYFIPGINGTPGQIRFALPSLVRLFGAELFVRCQSLKEFSSQKPIWEKYSLTNVQLKVKKTVQDLLDLSKHAEKIKVIANSNGFYDFVRAQTQLPDEVKRKITVLWISFAPDHFEVSPWVDLFDRFSGFDHEGFSWVAVPNHNLLSGFNAEAQLTRSWSEGNLKRTNDKRDLEARFHAWGAWWAYTSPSCFNRVLKYLTQDVEPISIPTFVLSAKRDGYWYGQSQRGKEETLKRYVEGAVVIERETSHLWISQPPHLEEFVRAIGLGNGFMQSL